MAIEILQTDLTRKLLIKWLKYQLPILITLVLYYILSPMLAGIQFPEFNWLELLPPSLTVNDMFPSVFGGSLSAISIIVGFFSVSIYRFIQDCESSYTKYQDEIIRIVPMKNQIEQKKEKLSNLKNKKETKEVHNEITEIQSLIDEEEKKYNDYNELLELNSDAWAHLQEHAKKFMVDYLTVAYYIFILYVILGLASVASNSLVVIMMYVVILSLSLVFTGLMIFLEETGFKHVHKDLHK